MSPDDDAPEPTAAPAATGAETVDFVGVPTRIDAVTVRTYASGTPRLRFSLSIPINKRNLALIDQLMLFTGMEVYAGFGFMQGALEFRDADDDGQPVDPADIGAGVPYVLNPGGDTVFPHTYIGGGPSGACVACELPRANVIHSDESIALRDANREAHKNGAGPIEPQTSDEALEAQADALIEQIPPEDSRVAGDAEAQAEATTSLANRSRR